MISVCRKSVKSEGSSEMYTNGEAKIDESCERQLVTGFCLQLSPSDSMGLMELWRGRWPSSVFFRSSEHYGCQLVECGFLCCSRTWISFPVLISKFCPLIRLCSEYFSCSKDTHIRCAGSSFEATERKRGHFHAPTAVIGRNWQGEVETAEPHLHHYYRLKGVTDFSALMPHFHSSLTHTAVEQIQLSTLLHKFQTERV